MSVTFDGVAPSDWSIGVSGGSGFGTISFKQDKLGFFGHFAASKPTITGSRGGNVALANLLTALGSGVGGIGRRGDVDEQRLQSRQSLHQLPGSSVVRGSL